MHVLHVMASGARGGGADHLLGLLPALRQLGVVCSAAVGAEGPLLAHLRAASVDTTAVQMMQARLNPRAIGQLTRLVQQRQPDVVHFHGTRAAFFGALARKAWGQKPRSVYTAHGLSYRKNLPLWRRGVFLAAEWLATRADAVISVSYTDLADLQRRGWLVGRSPHHIANAVDIQRFKPGSAHTARHRLGLTQNAVFVGTTSRLVRQKAVGDLLTAALPCPEVVVVVMGDGPQRAALQAHPLSRAGRVVFLGSRDDVAACLPAFDIFALASHWEGEPIALLEAQACGLPCVATRTPGAVEILGDDGVLVDVAAPAQLTEALAKLIANPARRAHLGALGVQRVQHRSYAQQARQIASVYNSL